MSATTPTTWTIKTLLTWTTDYLKSKGTSPREARLEAQTLLAHVMKCPKIELVARSDEEPSADEKTRFRELIKQRLDGCPVAYLVGRRDFYLLSFEVSPAVLIPRPDTETLVEQALRILKPLPSPAVLDLGTGSGCVAISLAHQSKTAAVTAVDLSPDALDVAGRNAAAHGVADRVGFLRGDLFEPLPADARFDLIVSNPPYIAHEEFADLAADVREYEPRLALDGGPDGLAFYRRIAAGTDRFLKPGGSVLVEIGWKQEPAVRALFDANAGWSVGPSVKDPGGHFRVVSAKKK